MGPRSYPLEAMALVRPRAVGRLAVHADDDLALGRARVHVVDPERPSISVRDLGVVGLEGKAGQIPKPLVGSSECFHAGHYIPFRARHRASRSRTIPWARWGHNFVSDVYRERDTL